jgi:hypothetical protein
MTTCGLAELRANIAHYSFQRWISLLITACHHLLSLFTALSLVISFIALHRLLPLAISCYRSSPLFRLPSLVIALHRLSSIFTACYLSLPLVIALAVRLVISCYRSSPLAIYLYRLSSLSLSGLPSLVIALHRLSSFFTALSLVISCYRSSPLVIFLYRLSSLDIALYRMSPFLLHLKSKKQKAKNQLDISWFFKLAVKNYCSSSIFSTLFLKSAPSFASRRPYSTKAFI